MSMPSSSSLEWVRTEADLFKGKSYRRETSTWFGVFLTVIGLPLGVALLFAFYIIGESSVPYTIISTATVTRDLLGGDDGKYNSLNAICRAPGGCMVFVRYTPRAHTEKCTESPLAGEGFHWSYVTNGEQLIPAPLVCYSPIATDGIFVAWLRYPPHHYCAVKADEQKNATAARKKCTETFLEAAHEGMWHPCPNLRTPEGIQEDRMLSCYEEKELWTEFYDRQTDSGQKAMKDDKLKCPGLDMSCAEFPYGFGLRTPAIASLTEMLQTSAADVCDKVEGGFLDNESPVMYGSHLILSQKISVHQFGCEFDAPYGYEDSDKTDWAYFSSSVQLATIEGLVPSRQQLPGEPDGPGISTDALWDDYVDKLDDLFNEIYCNRESKDGREIPTCKVDWAPDNAVGALAMLYEMGTDDLPGDLPGDQARRVTSRYLRDNLVIARLRASPQLQITSVTKKNLAMLSLLAVGGYVSLMMSLSLIAAVVYRAITRAVLKKMGRASDAASDASRPKSYAPNEGQQAAV